MDPETAKKVNELAQNLKTLHMATTMEEAIEKAKEIILGTIDDSKSIKELMSEVEEEKSDLKKDTEALKDIQDDLKDIKNLQKTDAELDEKKAEDMQKIEKSLDEIEKDAKLIKDNVDTAEFIQEEE
jgi:hypothetical protein